MRKHSENRAVKIMGIDLAKKSLHVYGEDAEGRRVIRKKFGRRKLKEYPANLPPGAYSAEDYRMLQQKSCSFDFLPGDEHCAQTRKTSCSLVQLKPDI